VHVALGTSRAFQYAEESLSQAATTALMSLPLPSPVLTMRAVASYITADKFILNVAWHLYHPRCLTQGGTEFMLGNASFRAR
jgi:hypothetical protein